MKKPICIVMFMTITLIAFSQTSAQNLAAAEAKVETARANLEAAKKELKDAYQPFIKDAKIEISANDEKIKELRARLVSPHNSPANKESEQKIDSLENRNVFLRNKIYECGVEKLN